METDLMVWSIKNMKRKTFTFRGHQISYLDSGPSDAPVLLLAHANGYSAGTYRFYIESLAKDHRVLAIDFTGHGQSEPNLNFRNWFFFRNQLICLLEAEGVQKVTGIGHSLGGASHLLAAQKRPNLYEKVIALDPVILDWPVILFSYLREGSLAKGARSRRRVFKNKQTVRKAFRRLAIFSRWQDNIFEDYLESCFEQVHEGFRLLCPPEVEAKIFSSQSLKAFLRHMLFRGEAHILIPKEFEVCSPKIAKRITSRHPNSHYEELDKATHFFPFEESERTLDFIQRSLSM